MKMGYFGINIRKKESDTGLKEILSGENINIYDCFDFILKNDKQKATTCV